MDFQSYDDYMRSVLGCSNTTCHDTCMSTITPYQNMDQAYYDLERMYPDTYRIIYPMVVSSCNMVTMPITEDMLNRMTDDIYDRAEADGRINIDINVMSRAEEESNYNRQISEDVRQRRPRRRNRFLRDLIRILILRELFGRRQRFPF